MQVQSLSEEGSLEEVMATHSSILAWRIPWTEVPWGLQSMGSRRVGHDCSDLVQHSTWCIFNYHFKNCKKKPQKYCNGSYFTSLLKWLLNMIHFCWWKEIYFSYNSLHMSSVLLYLVEFSFSIGVAFGLPQLENKDEKKCFPDFCWLIYPCCDTVVLPATESSLFAWEVYLPTWPGHDGSQTTPVHGLLLASAGFCRCALNWPLMPFLSLSSSCASDITSQGWDDPRLPQQSLQTPRFTLTVTSIKWKT